MRRSALVLSELSVLWVLAVLLGACSPEETGPVHEWDHPSNYLANASFEEGRLPWFNLATDGNKYWSDFRVTDAQAHSGSKSALFELRSEGREATCVMGVIALFEGVPIPAHIGGWYRVEDWQRGTPLQFTQVVVSLHGTRGYDHPPGIGTQIAWILDGLDAPPYPMGNRKFFPVGKKRPVQGRWQRFDIDLARDFEEAWGPLPTDYDQMYVFFEARYDQRLAGAERPVHADVYFDDLYLGDGVGTAPPDAQRPAPGAR